MDEATNWSSDSSPVLGQQYLTRGRDISDLSRDELLAHIDALEMEISGKDGIIQSLQGDLSVSSDQILNIPAGYRLRLENTVTEQNLTIEALKEELERKQDEYKKLTDELFSLKTDASKEIAELKKESERKKTRWKQEKQVLEDSIQNMKESFEKEASALDSSLSSEVDKNLLLEKQVDLFIQRIEELDQRGVEHDEEFDAIRKYWEEEFNKLRRVCDEAQAQDPQKISPDLFESLRNQLSESLVKNTELNAMIKSFESTRAVVREELQCNLQEALHKINVVTANLKSSEKRNVELEKACRLHEAQLEQLKTDPTNNSSEDMLNFIQAFKQLCKLISLFGYHDSDLAEGLDLSSENVSQSTSSSDDLFKWMLDKVKKCTLAIDRNHEHFSELGDECEKLIEENDILRKNTEELELYKGSVVQLKTELDKIKHQYELLGKNNENVIMTLKKDLEVSKSDFDKLQTEKNTIVKVLEDELNRCKCNNEELERKCKLLQDLISSNGVDCGVKERSPTGSSGNRIPNNDLQATRNVCFKCNETTCLESGQLSPIGKAGVPTDVTPPKSQAFSNFTTSTPFPAHLKGGGESIPPHPIVLEESHYQLALIRWMETCRDLNSENGELKNQVSDLEMQLKELQLSASTIREEMIVFDLKRKDLELKLTDYSAIKNECRQLEESLKLNQLKLSGMEKDIILLESENKRLHEENEKFECQFNELLATTESSCERGQVNISETLFNDLNQKVKEVVLLKGQVKSLLQAKRALQERNDRLLEAKNLYVLKLEETSRELSNYRNEVDILILGNMKLSTSNKSFEKEVKMLRIKVEHLNGLREQNWGRSEKNSLAEQMQKDILAICKETIDTKFECDKLLSARKKPDQRVDEMDARHRMELLMKENAQLAHEKETLLLTITELQKLIHGSQRGIGCDEGWLMHLEEFENQLLQEMRDHKEQHARIEEALRSTGSLHNELQKEKDDKKIKVIESAKLEKKYQTEKLRAQQLDIESKVLKQELIDIREMMKVLKKENQELEGNLAAANGALEVTQEKLEFELQCNRLRLKQVELQNANNEMLENFLTSSWEEKPYFDVDLDYHKQIRQEVEAQYAQALQTMKQYLTAEFTLKAQEEQSYHNEQINHFKTIIREQSEAIEKLASAQIVCELTQGKREIPEYKLLLENMGKCKNEIEDAMSTIASNEDAIRIKKAFQEYFNYQLFLAQRILQDEHRSQYALAVNTWEQLHESEMKLVKLQLEADHFKEKLDEFAKVPESSENKISVPDVFLEEEPKLTTSQYIFLVLLKSYFSHVESYTADWCSAYRREMKIVDGEMRKELINFGNKIEKKLKDGDLVKSESLLSKGESLVSTAKGFIESIQGLKKELLSGVTQTLDSVFDATKNTLQDFKRDNARLDHLRTLEEDIIRLKREKEEAEKQYSAALGLLKSDHDIEVKKLDSILIELKHLTEIGCRADALLRLKDELEDKHKKEAEEMRTWFERKVADLQKNFSEEIFSQHSRQMSSSSSCPDDDLDRDKLPPDFQCEPGEMNDAEDNIVDLSDLFPGGDGVKSLKSKSNILKRGSKKDRCADCVSCAAKVLSRVILDESQREVERELIRAVQHQDIDSLRTPCDRESKLFTQGVADWEVEERGSSIVAKTIDKIGFECFKSLKDHLESNIQGQIKKLESSVVYQLSKIGNMLDSETEKLNELNNRVVNSFPGTKMSEGKKLPNRPVAVNEVDRLLHDREDLDTIKTTLTNVVTKMSQYLSKSENELISQMKGELVKLCAERPKKEKHVHFGSNLTSIIQELDDTLNNESFLDRTQDSSTRFREDIHSCIKKLKLEAAALYQLSNQANPSDPDSNKLVSQIEALRRENMALLEEMNDIKMNSQNQFDGTGRSFISVCSDLEAVYGDSEDQPKSMIPNSDYLQNKARKHLLQVKDSSVTKALEDIFREADLVIEELQARCDDLEQQVEVADKQLRATRQFLEEQAVEREGERDEYSREVSSLQALLREKDKEFSARERFTTEVLASGARNATPSSRKVEELGKDLKETTDRLNESKDKERLLQVELKAAIDQVWVLRDIIKNLETQVMLKSEKETELENKLDKLAEELEEKNGAQSVMAHEIETLRNQSLEDSRGFEQLQELEENIKLRFNSSVIRQFQAQIKEMGKVLDTQTRELEGNHVGASSNSLSSPSEEISIREHIEFFNRSKTPEHCPSPVSLPVDEVNKLHEKIVRHARADEVILKKLNDQEIRIVKMTNFSEEVQAERDILHEHVEKLKSQIAEANNKIDFLRHKADANNAAANRDIITENQKLKDALSEAEQTLNKLNHQLQEKEGQLENAEDVISAQQDKLRSLVQCDENALESLRLELAAVLAEKNKLEGLVDKYKSDLQKYGTHPSELKALLADKNEDIKLLQDTIARYQNDNDKSSRGTKGLRVSFAAEAESSDSFPSHESKLRDCPVNESFHFDDVSHLAIQPLKSSTHKDIEVSLIQHSPVDTIVDPSLARKNSLSGDDGVVDKLSLELMEKDQCISKLEEKLSNFQQIEQELLKTKAELEATVAAITEDKNYYEEQLTSMLNEIKMKDNQCSALEKLLSSKGSEILKLSGDIETLQNLVALTQEKLNEAQVLAEKENIGSEVSQMKLSRLEIEINKLQLENSTLQDNIAQVRSDNDKLRDKINHLTSENNSLKTKLTEIDLLKKTVEDRYSAMQSLKSDLESKILEVNEENKNLKAELVEFESIQKHFEKTQEHLSSLLSENESLQATLNNMRVAYERQSGETNQLKAAGVLKVSELQDELTSLRKHAEELTVSLNNEQTVKNELQKLSEDLYKKLESFRHESQSLAGEKHTLVETNKDMHKELENFRTSVKNLRNDLASLKNKEGPYISLLSNIDCDDVKKLYLEVSKLISEVGQLEFERNCLQQELAKVRSASTEVVLKEAELDKLSEQITRLEEINSELKANNNRNMEQLRAEIMKLSDDIKHLQAIERQANEKLTVSLADNKKLGAKLSKMEKELNEALSSRKSTSDKGLQVSPYRTLCKTATEVFEHLPGTQGSDYKRESQGNLNLRSAPFQQSLDRETGCQCGQKYNNSALEAALFEKMRIIEDLKDKLNASESATRALRADKLDVQLNLKTLEKINELQEKKLEIVSSEMRHLSSDRLQLELDVHNEKTSRLHAENELSTERLKTQSIQMENINMMENMRSRLKLALENEAKLKSMVLEKHGEYESAVAKLNNVMVMERYRSESENEGLSSSSKKRLAQSQDTCKTLRFELEKQERVNADLNAVLVRERRSLASVQEQLKSLEGECNKLKTDLRNEVIKREILQDQLHEYMSANDRSSTDSEKVQSLQRECARLRENVEILQELNEQWRASAYTPVLEQLNELNSNVDSLANKKRELQSAVNDLERERNFLAGQISQLREERANMRLSSERMDFAPSVSAKLDIYLGRYFRAESYRKSLVSQKKYLTVVLSGFERAHQRNISALVPDYKKNRKRPSFKGVVQTVVAVNRMKFFVRKRKLNCEAAYLGLLRALGFTNEDALVKAGREVRPQTHQNYSNSPPTKDHQMSEDVRRLRVQTTSHSDYLAALQEVQKLTRKS